MTTSIKGFGNEPRLVVPTQTRGALRATLLARRARLHKNKANKTNHMLRRSDAYPISDVPVNSYAHANLHNYAVHAEVR